MNDLLLAALFAGFAAITVWVEHYLLPDWYPQGYTVIFTYLEGSATIFVWGLIWAYFTGHLIAAVAFLVIGLGGAASIIAAYRRDHVTERRRQAQQAAQAAHAAQGVDDMIALLTTDEEAR